ncbi:response regulator transcription factor [bacterium]|nr:MAG: response regulator transcription factor [bacterium]
MNEILLIDDDTALCGLLTELLEREGFNVQAVQDGETGVERAIKSPPSLIVLDVMMPGIGGFETLRQLRASGGLAAHTPVLMLTARGEDVDRIVGLEIGADDYLPKPFNPRELVARIGAILRRSAREAALRESTTAIQPNQEVTPSQSQWLTVGDLEIMPTARAVRCAGKSIELTTVEFDLLLTLINSAGQIVSRQKITRAALGRDVLPFDRAIDTHVSNLRRKLGPDSGGSERIKTVRNIGYLYATSSQQTGAS